MVQAASIGNCFLISFLLSSMEVVIDGVDFQGRPVVGCNYRGASVGFNNRYTHIFLACAMHKREILVGIFSATAKLEG